MCFSPQCGAIFRHQNIKKMLRERQFLNIFTSKCAFRHSGVQLFDISTAKVLPDPQFFNILTSKCVFRHSGVHFSTSELQKMLRTLSFFNILTSACASRHSGVQFFDIWTSKSASELTCFVHFRFKMCFSPQRRAIFDFSSAHLPPYPPL